MPQETNTPKRKIRTISTAQILLLILATWAFIIIAHLWQGLERYEGIKEA